MSEKALSEVGRKEEGEGGGGGGAGCMWGEAASWKI